MHTPSQRLVEGPEGNLLQEDEVARYLRFSVDTLRRLVERGEFPTPLESSDRGRVWPWKDVLWYTLDMEVRVRLPPRKPHRAAQKGHAVANGETVDSDS
jgi:predicted DNA-binding transcriptional regulator AlpA